MKTVIGLDFGTQGARAILADAADGRVLAQSRVEYAHGILPGDLAHAGDYDDALLNLLEAVAPPEYRSSVAGVCVDATSLTLVPLNAAGTPLGELDEFAGEPQAQVKLWKRHTAQPWADEAEALARATGQPFLGRAGGAISCEWMLPKLLEIRDTAPNVWAQMDLAMDLCDYLTFRLTGRLVRGRGSMCFKCLWSEDLGFPPDSYLEALRPGFSGEYRSLLRGEVLSPGRAAGALRPELCRRLGFSRDVPVAAGILDGHTAPAALGALSNGDATLVAGTSNVLAVQTGVFAEIPGVCGIAQNGFVDGLYGIDSGQACTGDMLGWFIRRALPEEILAQARQRNESPYDALRRRVRSPWQCRVAAVDWFNGSRNAPCDLALPGALVGLTMDTAPEDIYLALLQSIACGTREILDLCDCHGVRVHRFFATGGVAEKNPLLMQLYADILGRPVLVGRTDEGPALGAAVYAAARLWGGVGEAHARMGVREFTQYVPDAARRADYEALYRKNHALREAVAAFQHNIEKWK